MTSTGAQEAVLPGIQQFQCIVPGTSQKLAVNGTSAQSNAMQAGTSLVRLFATQNMFIAIGANPTAVADTSMFVPAGIETYIGVPPGQSYKIAGIWLASAGSLYITEGL